MKNKKYISIHRLIGMDITEGFVVIEHNKKKKRPNKNKRRGF
jgi:hypothetical protein